MNLKSQPIRSIEELQSHTKNPLNRCVLPLDKPVQQGPQLLLCHDMAGGYLEDCWIQGSNTSTKVYNIQYWQYVDIFCYFSHERIAIPPVVWTNACHRNEVTCIGTIIVEGREGIEECLRLIYGPAYNRNLPSTQRDYSPVYADILVDLAYYYGFDGYLVNIESPLPSGAHCIVLRNFLTYFTKKMKEKIPHGLVIWYDSVIYTGQLRWQDQVNSNNHIFFDVCDAIFTNYTWNEKRLQESASNALDRKHQVFTGIDVWGRRTFGGGGFNVHKALREIKLAGTSASIFAPAWTFEKLGFECFELSEARFWIEKTCVLPFSEMEKSTFEIKLDENDIGCVSEMVQPKFNNHLFYCCFDQGFGKSFFIDGKQVSAKPWQHLSRQSISVSFRQLMVYSGIMDEYGTFLGEDSRTGTAKIHQEPPIFQGGHSLKINVENRLGRMHFIPLFRSQLSLGECPIFTIEIVVQRQDPGLIGISYTCSKSGIVKLLTVPSSCCKLEGGWEKLIFESKPIADGRISGDFGICTDTSIIVGSFALVPKSDVIPTEASINLSLDRESHVLTWADSQHNNIDSRHVFVNDEYVGTAFTNHFMLDHGNIKYHKVAIVGKDIWNRTMFLKTEYI